VVEHTLVHMHLPFSFSSDFVRLYFGKKLDRHVSYNEFTQLLNVSASVTACVCMCQPFSIRVSNVSALPVQCKCVNYPV